MDANVLMDMDVNVLISYVPKYAEAFLLTVRIGWLGILLSVVLGIVSAFTIYFRIPVLSRIAGAYVEIFRNTPLLVQLFFLYFGIPKLGFSVSAETCGIVGMGLLGGSYMSEAFRSSLGAVPESQRESAEALGMTSFQAFFRVILPEAWILSIPAVVANVIFLLKETSVFSAISLMDLMFTAKDLIGLYYDTTEALFLLVVFYIIMLVPVSAAGSILEKRARYKMFGE